MIFLICTFTGSFPKVFLTNCLRFSCTNIMCFVQICLLSLPSICPLSTFYFFSLSASPAPFLLYSLRMLIIFLPSTRDRAYGYEKTAVGIKFSDWYELEFSVLQNSSMLYLDKKGLTIKFMGVTKSKRNSL